MSSSSLSVSVSVSVSLSLLPHFCFEVGPFFAAWFFSRKTGCKCGPVRTLLFSHAISRGEKGQTKATKKKKRKERNKKQKQQRKPRLNTQSLLEALRQRTHSCVQYSHRCAHEHTTLSLKARSLEKGKSRVCAATALVDCTCPGCRPGALKMNKAPSQHKLKTKTASTNRRWRCAARSARS